MEEDIILNQYGKKNKQGNKAKIYKTVRKFLKWKFGENKVYPEFCDNWVTSEEAPTKIFLTRPEVDKLINAASFLRVKTYIMMLFDGGFRVEELANLRWLDVLKPDGKEYYRAFVRKETSKTKKPRHVSLWLATDLIDSFRNSEKARLKKDFKEDNFIFETGYQPLYRTIKRLGKRILNKDISPHSLRHSSATYYSNITKTYQQFCARYGWNLKSGTAQRYFHATEDDEMAEQTKDHEIARFKTEVERIKIENMRLREGMEDLKKDMPKMVAQLMKESLSDLKKARELKKKSKD